MPHYQFSAGLVDGKPVTWRSNALVLLDGEATLDVIEADTERGMVLVGVKQTTRAGVDVTVRRTRRGRVHVLWVGDPPLR